MFLTTTQTVIIILAVALGTIITRFLPFILFPEKNAVPAYITFLGKALPAAMMGLLVVYCFKGVYFADFPFGLPEFIAIIAIVVLHKWKRNVLLSIGGGTAIYMILVQAVFV